MNGSFCGVYRALFTERSNQVPPVPIYRALLWILSGSFCFIYMALFAESVGLFSERSNEVLRVPMDRALLRDIFFLQDV